MVIVLPLTGVVVVAPNVLIYKSARINGVITIEVSVVTSFKTICPEFPYYDLNAEEYRKIKLGQAIQSQQPFKEKVILATFESTIVSVLDYYPTTNTLRPNKNL